MERDRLLFLASFGLSSVGSILFLAGYSAPYWEETWDSSQSSAVTWGLWRKCVSYNSCVPREATSSYLEAVQAMETLALIAAILVFIMYAVEIYLHSRRHPGLTMTLNMATVLFSLTGISVWVENTSTSLSVSVYLVSAAVLFYVLAGCTNLAEMIRARTDQSQDGERAQVLGASDKSNINATAATTTAPTKMTLAAIQAFRNQRKYSSFSAD